MNKNKLAAMKKLSEEFKDLQEKPAGNCGCTVGYLDMVKKDIFQWKITMIGPADSPYAGGLFSIRVLFKEGYPAVKPEAQFITTIWHVNVGVEPVYGYEKGHICISSINNWEDRYNNPQHRNLCNMRKVVWDIFSLFYKQNPGSPMNPKAAEQYRAKDGSFERTVKEYVTKFAN